MAKYVDYDDWKVQLAYDIEKAKLKPDEWICITQKINGCRATYFNKNLVSRSGKKFVGLDRLNTKIQVLSDMLWQEYKIRFIFDGELILLPEFRTELDIINFQQAVGIANSTVNMSNKYKLQYIIFDVLPRKDFVEENSSMSYKERLTILGAIKTTIKQLDIKIIDTVPVFYYGIDHSEINKWLQYANNNDMEGIMINRDWPYKFRRTKGLLKVKTFNTIDLEVIGFTQGKPDGKYRDTLGAIVIKYGNNCVSVGSGFTDSMRHEIWNNKDKYMNKICEVKYKTETMNKETGLKSIDFPVFLCFRDDKEIADEV